MNYKTKGVKTYPFKMSTSKKPARTTQKGIVSSYRKAMSELKETQATAKKYGIQISSVPIKKLSSMSKEEANKYINSLNNFNKRNRFINSNGRINNQYVIDTYNKAVKNINKAKKDLRGNIIGKSKLSEGKVITQDGKRQTIKAIDIKTGASELNTVLKEYNTKRDLNDNQLLTKANKMKMTTKELKGEKENSLFKANYLKGLLQQQKDGVITQDEYDALKNAINELTTAQLLEWFYREEYSQLGFTYSLDDESLARQAQASSGLVKSLTSFSKKVSK